MRKEPGGLAIYRQIAEEVKAEIEAGRLKPGDQVPSETVMIERYDVTRMTIRQAMRYLRDLDLVETRHGLGTYVKGD